MSVEIWKAIEGQNGYEVSSAGRVRSIDRVILRCNGRPCRRKGALLKGIPDKDGYLTAFLAGRTCHKIHRLVLSTFVENPENKRTVNHKNGDKTDNRLKNSEWMTDQENVIHAFRVLGIRGCYPRAVAV